MLGYRRGLLAVAFGVAFGVALGISPSPVSATPVFGGGENEGFFTSVENWIDVDKSGFISAGDQMYGIFQVQGIKNDGVDIWGQDNVPAGGLDTFTGYFAHTIGSVTLVADLPGTANDIVSLGFVPLTTADPNGILSPADIAAGVIFKAYIDSSTAFEANGTVADDIAKATDGTLFWSLGITDALNEYFYAPTAALDPNGLFALGSGATVSNALFGLEMIFNGTGYIFGLVNDPSESNFNTDVDIYANVEVVDKGGPTTAATQWRFQDNDPFVVRAVPEPGTLLLLSGGLLILAFAMGRRKGILATQTRF